MDARTADREEPCIYCSSVLARVKREHVISQAIGTFEHNWTLKCVCDQCNKYFADNLELVLGRDSAEGFMRVDKGVKPPETIDKFKNQRSVFTLQDGGQFHGARVVMRAAGSTMAPHGRAQVGLRREGEDWRFYLENELDAGAVSAPNGIRVEVKVIGHHGQDDLERLVAKLEALGLPFTETTRAMDQPLSAESRIAVLHEFPIDDINRRAAAKIGLNYLAYVFGGDVARHSDLDPVRWFVRHGEEPRPLVSFQELSILVGPDAASSSAHACGVRWEPSQGALVGIVSLFNKMTYGILLTTNPLPQWTTMAAQHLFDPLGRTITNVQIAK